MKNAIIRKGSSYIRICTLSDGKWNTKADFIHATGCGFCTSVCSPHGGTVRSTRRCVLTLFGLIRRISDRFNSSS